MVESWSSHPNRSSLPYQTESLSDSNFQYLPWQKTKYFNKFTTYIEIKYKFNQGGYDDDDDEEEFFLWYGWPTKNI